MREQPGKEERDGGVKREGTMRVSEEGKERDRRTKREKNETSSRRGEIEKRDNGEERAKSC